uniref:WRKY domain-containing protein n=1 Tax=Araucaria cunninghamii TaxID=56994 RepID=A0A0D6QV75_ARACU
MEGKESRSGMAEGGGVLLTKPAPSRPSIELPPRTEGGMMSVGYSPGPMSLVSSFFAEHDPDSECKSFSQLLAGAMASPPARESKPTVAGGGSAQSGSGASTSGSSSSAKFKCMPPTSIPIPRSPFLCLPHGLSPSSLLDSPMLLSNSQVEPSPTTGNFPLVPIKEENAEKEGGSNFVFKPFPKGPFEVSHQQVLAQIQAQALAQAQAQAHGQIQAHTVSCPPPASSSTASSLSLQPSSSLTSSCGGAIASTSNVIIPEKKTESQLETKYSPGSSSKESNQTVAVSVPPVPVVEKPSADGYNWRKYGQKQVKGSEYPRSYYKCTHPNCPVKKKVERSHNGQVTEIVYKGEHNHPKPQPTRRMALVSHQYLSNSAQEVSGGGDMKARANGSSQGFSGDPGGRSERNGEGSDPSTSMKVNNIGNGSLEQTSGSSGDHGVADEGDDDEPDSKRSKKEKKEKEVLVVAPLRTIREPRVVVQTRSDVDILDDGYRWRKYGQKVVKGNPHPRSYYKCTNLGCPVRKHVERASNDAKAVITTYEGKHNHDVPAARHSSHDIIGTVSQAQSANTSVSGTVVANLVNSQQIGNKQSAFSRISESGSEGKNDANTQGGVGEQTLPICNSSHSGIVQTAAPSGSVPSLTCLTNPGRSVGNSDNAAVSGTDQALETIKPKEEQ